MPHLERRPIASSSSSSPSKHAMIRADEPYSSSYSDGGGISSCSRTDCSSLFDSARRTEEAREAALAMASLMSMSRAKFDDEDDDAKPNAKPENGRLDDDEPELESDKSERGGGDRPEKLDDDEEEFVGGAGRVELKEEQQLEQHQEEHRAESKKEQQELEQHEEQRRLELERWIEDYKEEQQRRAEREHERRHEQQRHEQRRRELELERRLELEWRKDRPIPGSEEERGASTTTTARRAVVVVAGAEAAALVSGADPSAPTRRSRHHHRPRPPRGEEDASTLFYPAAALAEQAVNRAHHRYEVVAAEEEARSSPGRRASSAFRARFAPKPPMPPSPPPAPQPLAAGCSVGRRPADGSAPSAVAAPAGGPAPVPGGSPATPATTTTATASASTATLRHVATVLPTDLNVNDVLFGNPTTTTPTCFPLCQTNVGNRRYRVTVAWNLGRYGAARRRQDLLEGLERDWAEDDRRDAADENADADGDADNERTNILGKHADETDGVVGGVVDCVTCECKPPGRFFVWDKNSGRYVCLTEREEMMARVEYTFERALGVIGGGHGGRLSFATTASASAAPAAASASASASAANAPSTAEALRRLADAGDATTSTASAAIAAAGAFLSAATATFLPPPSSVAVGTAHPPRSSAAAPSVETHPHPAKKRRRSAVVRFAPSVKKARMGGAFPSSSSTSDPSEEQRVKEAAAGKNDDDGSAAAAESCSSSSSLARLRNEKDGIGGAAWSSSPCDGPSSRKCECLSAIAELAVRTKNSLMGKYTDGDDDDDDDIFEKVRYVEGGVKFTKWRRHKKNSNASSWDGSTTHGKTVLVDRLDDDGAVPKIPKKKKKKKAEGTVDGGEGSSSSSSSSSVCSSSSGTSPSSSRREAREKKTMTGSGEPGTGPTGGTVPPPSHHRSASNDNNDSATAAAAAASTATATANAVIEPTNNDVLCPSSAGFVGGSSVDPNPLSSPCCSPPDGHNVNRVGNMRFRVMVQLNLARYRDAASSSADSDGGADAEGGGGGAATRRRRSEVIASVLDALAGCTPPARFLRWRPLGDNGIDGRTEAEAEKADSSAAASRGRGGRWEVLSPTVAFGEADLWFQAALLESGQSSSSSSSSSSSKAVVAAGAETTTFMQKKKKVEDGEDGADGKERVSASAVVDENKVLAPPATEVPADSSASRKAMTDAYERQLSAKGTPSKTSGLDERQLTVKATATSPSSSDEQNPRPTSNNVVEQLKAEAEKAVARAKMAAARGGRFVGPDGIITARAAADISKADAAVYYEHQLAMEARRAALADARRRAGAVRAALEDAGAEGNKPPAPDGRRRMAVAAAASAEPGLLALGRAIGAPAVGEEEREMNRTVAVGLAPPPVAPSVARPSSSMAAAAAGNSMPVYPSSRAAPTSPGAVDAAALMGLSKVAAAKVVADEAAKVVADVQAKAQGQGQVQNSSSVTAPNLERDPAANAEPRPRRVSVMRNPTNSEPQPSSSSARARRVSVVNGIEQQCLEMASKLLTVPSAVHPGSRRSPTQARRVSVMGRKEDEPIQVPEGTPRARRVSVIQQQPMEAASTSRARRVSVVQQQPKDGASHSFSVPLSRPRPFEANNMEGNSVKREDSIAHADVHSQASSLTKKRQLDLYCHPEENTDGPRRSKIARRVSKYEEGNFSSLLESEAVEAAQHDEVPGEKGECARRVSYMVNHSVPQRPFQAKPPQQPPISQAPKLASIPTGEVGGLSPGFGRRGAMLTKKEDTRVKPAVEGQFEDACEDDEVEPTKAASDLSDVIGGMMMMTRQVPKISSPSSA